MAKIKICGLSRPQDIDYVNELKPDYIGYVFWEKSRRYVTAEQARLLTERLLPDIVPVGVFVDADCEFAARLLKEGIIRIAQLHGHEDEEYAGRLRTLTNKPIIKAFKVRSAKDVEQANAFPSDYVLFDNGCGTGRTFDWSCLSGAQRPFFLAGGINRENAGKVLAAVAPYALDISSGVETEGHKDYNKIKDFIHTVRKCL